jgi:hypothetical protein
VEVKPELKGPEALPNDPGTGVKKMTGEAPPALLKLPEDTSKKPGKISSNPDNRKPTRESVEAAWRTLNEFNAILAASRAKVIAQTADRNSIYQIIRNTAAPSESPVVQTSVAAAQTPPTPQGPQPALTPSRVSLGQPKSDSTPSLLSPPIASQPMPPNTLPMDNSLLAPPLSASPMTRSGTVVATPNVMASPVEEQPEPKLAAPATQPPTPMPASTSAAAKEPVNSITPIVTQVLYGTTPMDRHTAIRQMMRFDWQKNPIIMSALLAGAKSDTTPAVRVDCMRHLAGYQMTHPQVIAELGPLTQDSDPWVRDEAVRALAQLKQAH